MGGDAEVKPGIEAELHTPYTLEMLVCPKSPLTHAFLSILENESSCYPGMHVYTW